MSNLSEAGRQIMWNISGAWVMYLLFFVALGVFAFGLYRRVAVWREGKADDERLGNWGERFLILVRELALQRRVRGSRFPGIFHSLIFYSFLALVITTAVVALDFDFGTTLFEGHLYVALTVAAELAGVLILVGVGMALVRRSALRPKTISTGPSDLWPPIHLGLLVLTGFLVEALRIAAQGDAHAALSPVGLLLALPFAGASARGLATAHQATWWVHCALSMGWIASLPYTKFFHLIALPMNVFFSKLGPRGRLSRMDLLELLELDDFDEDSLVVGVGSTRDFTWKQRLDFDACISCGRCEEVCPSFDVGNPFSPKEFIQGCRDLCAGEAAAREGARPEQGSDPGEYPDGGIGLIGPGFDEGFVWFCRTCTACMEVCPAAVDHLDTLIEVRRNEVLVNGRLPDEAARALRQMDVTGNPFGPQGDREDWIDSLGVRVVGPGERCDVLYWIGCCTAFDPDKQRIAVDVCTLLEQCGIDFGVLGRDERCCGDPARVLGEERLFQETAREQVEQLEAREFRVLLTSCPHCYNVLKNEYPQFGGKYHVVHHSEFLHEMMWAGRLVPKIGLARRVVYHDPCYLGRYQHIYDAPREVLRGILGADLPEMRDHRDHSMCCGGGGGHFWMDLKKGERINNRRVTQALEAGADTIVTSCAYCKQMLDDAVKTMDLDERIEVVDIASLVVSTQRSLPAETKTDAA